jgi:D-proline reductase (dithiol) PrdB
VVVDSFKFLPRTFRPLYEGRGPFPGEDEPVWAPFEKRLARARIALLTSAGMYLKDSQPSFDLEREQTHPEWGDPTWRSIPATASAEGIGVAHLHINDDDLLADPEIALPMHLLGELADEGMIGGAVAEHVSVMGFQERSLRDWHETTAPELVAHLRDQVADGLILAPA